MKNYTVKIHEVNVTTYYYVVDIINPETSCKEDTVFFKYVGFMDPTIMQLLVNDACKYLCVVREWGTYTRSTTIPEGSFECTLNAGLRFLRGYRIYKTVEKSVVTIKKVEEEI